MNNPGPTESELKIPVADLGAVSDRLCGLQAECVQASSREVNVLLDRADRGLSSAGQVLRLRAYGTRHILTFKGPASYLDRVKSREELELEVADPAVTIAILERLGFRPWMRYEKDRALWRLGPVEVALDHTPMGDFVELEGPPEELRASAERLGLDAASAVRGSYIQLWHEHRARHAALPADMVFGE